MNAQPGPVALPVRAAFCHQRPEFVRMVHLLEVGAFVRRHIIEHLRRGHDQAPGEGQLPVRRAGAPT